MTALPLAPSANAVRDAVQRLGAIHPGPYRVVSCYLKLEPRDKTRGKYLIKMKNRIREAGAALERQSLERAVRDQVAADLERIRRYFEEPGDLPRTRGVALFACRTIGLFDVIPLPHVYRSRLAVEPVPLIRELVALEQEFGTILVAACDRTGARFFEVTAFDVAELPGLRAEATRPGKFHGQRQAKRGGDRKSTRLNSSHGYISDAVFCLKKKKKHKYHTELCTVDWCVIVGFDTQDDS